MRLQDFCCYLIRKHGGVRPAARALKLAPSYLQRLAEGQKINPSPATLAKLGLIQEINYKSVPGTKLPNNKLTPVNQLLDTAMIAIRLFGEQCYQDGKVNNEYETVAHHKRHAELLAAIQRLLMAQ